ncbi:MAG: alpha-E domain-containing protein [Chloroflexi bacterium]|nr:alpha-E domain-containing protein [Chloroflexota bacterium]
MTTDPRSLNLTTNPWMTDSRVYNLVWLGRWMERADNVLRAIDSAALLALDASESETSFRRNIKKVAAGLGASAKSDGDILESLLRTHENTGVLRSTERARNNANEVAPLELIQALNQLITALNAVKLPLTDPDEIHKQMTELLTHMSHAFSVVETKWFRREALSQEEVYRRFVQQ